MNAYENKRDDYRYELLQTANGGVGYLNEVSSSSHQISEKSHISDEYGHDKTVWDHTSNNIILILYIGVCLRFGTIKN